MSDFIKQGWVGLSVCEMLKQGFVELKGSLAVQKGGSSPLSITSH